MVGFGKWLLSLLLTHIICLWNKSFQIIYIELSLILWFWSIYNIIIPTSNACLIASLKKGVRFNSEVFWQRLMIWKRLVFLWLWNWSTRSWIDAEGETSVYLAHHSDWCTQSQDCLYSLSQKMTKDELKHEMKCVNNSCKVQHKSFTSDYTPPMWTTHCGTFWRTLNH